MARQRNMSIDFHPLHQKCHFLPSASLLILPPTETNRYKHSFLLSAVSSKLQAERVVYPSFLRAIILT